MRELISTFLLSLVAATTACSGPSAPGGGDLGAGSDTGAIADLSSSLDSRGTDSGIRDMKPPSQDLPPGDITATVDGNGRAFITQEARYSGSGTGILGANTAFQGIAVFFPGKSTGTFNCPPLGPTVGVNYSDGTAHWTTVNQTGAACTITVTAYEAVGGRITGTFTATAPRIPSPGSIVVITNGTFNVLRQPDQ